ncbi:MAG: copper chaperone PCu(A)C [Aestuariivirga sp.]
MRKLTLEILAAIALTLAAILASAHGVLASDVLVMDAFARASATPKATSAVIYISLVNHAAQADRFIAITSSSAAMAHLHDTKSVNGVISMEPVETLDLAPGQSVVMKPGGLHIMLTGLKAPLKEGESLTLELTFEKAGKIAVEVPVRSVAAQASGG